MTTSSRNYLLPGLLVLLLVLLTATLLTCYHQSCSLKEERVYREFYTHSLREQVRAYLKKVLAEYGVEPNCMKVKEAVGPSSFELTYDCFPDEAQLSRLLAAAPYITQELYALGARNGEYCTRMFVQVGEQPVTPHGVKSSVPVPGCVIQVKCEGAVPTSEFTPPAPYSYLRAAELMRKLQGMPDKMQDAASVQQVGGAYMTACREFIDEYFRLFELDDRRSEPGWSLRFKEEFGPELLAMLRAVSRLHESGYYGVQLLQTEEDRQLIRCLEHLRLNLERAQSPAADRG